MREMRHALVLADPDGSIEWIPMAIFKSTCKIDITDFPFDHQMCHMKFGSWTYDGNQLDLEFISNASFSLGDYTPSNEWDVNAAPAQRYVKFYPCCDDPYPDLTYFLL
ncbi:unnamed protein product [Protopolystoma xenopodis]|uniref:Neurotransmitter-gated ion-channel ligand-binding domain-containing protein n=1 Tax=Protopolystoma xenopodis TaxID=117903 RepID=A0A448XN11_9PLAT|nr:unnamed protein product [Protopolystoma xenopodis]